MSKANVLEDDARFSARLSRRVTGVATQYFGESGDPGRVIVPLIPDQRKRTIRFQNAKNFPRRLLIVKPMVRELAMEKGAWANIPLKSNRSGPICFSLYRARNQVERFFNRIKQCRRVATRYDRLAANYLAFVQPASIRLWLAARYESAP